MAKGNPRRSPGRGAVAGALEDILSRYETVRRRERFGKGSSVWEAFSIISDQFKKLDTLGGLDVRWSAGQGRWATVPWISIMDPRETKKIREGVYIVWLFREDMSGVYLALSQGASALLTAHGAIECGRILRERAELFRSRTAELPAAQFSSARIDLRSSMQMSRCYEDATILARLYERGCVADDGDLFNDVGALVKAYRRLVPTRRLLNYF